MAHEGGRDSSITSGDSNHGETLFEREWTMDHGAQPYDEQARVPLVLRLPGRRLAGHHVPEQVSLVDVAPTICDVVGIAPLEGMQGRSLLPLIEGRSDATPPRPAFITARPEPNRLPRHTAQLTRRDLTRAVRLPGSKLIEYPSSPGRWIPELYDLTRDPGEVDNLAHREPEAASALRHRLHEWRRSIGWNEPLPPNELAPDVQEALRALGYLDE